MLTYVTKNNAKSKIADAINASVALINVAAGTGDRFPDVGDNQYFPATLSDATGVLNEIVHVTARVGDQLTVLRGQEGTTAQIWPALTSIESRWTSAQAQGVIQTDLESASDIIDAVIVNGVLTLDVSGAIKTYRIVLNRNITSFSVVGAIEGKARTIQTIFIGDGTQRTINWGSIAWPFNVPPNIPYVVGTESLLSFMATPTKVYGIPGWQGYPAVGLPYLAEYLGYQNVFYNGDWWSYSQQGDFTSVYIIDQNTLGVSGPNSEFPVGKLVKRVWNIQGCLIIVLVNGQSNTVGATSNLAGVLDAVTPFMQLAPLPGKLMAVTGGFEPTQDGVGSDGVTTIIAPPQYEGVLVNGHENINTGRDTGKEVNRQTWASSLAQVLAAAVRGTTSVILKINTGHGSTTFAEDVEHAVLLTGASWVGGVVSFVFVSQTNVGANDKFTITNSNPTDYNGEYTAVTSDGITVTAIKVSDPGVYVGSGFGLVASAPMVNLRTMLRYAVNTIAPALGLTTYLAGFGYEGNEANDDLASVANFATMFATLRKYADEFSDIAGNEDPCWIVWPQVGWPVAGWQNDKESLFNCASNVALGILDMSLDPANRCITFAQWRNEAGGLGDANDVGCIHYSVQGHWNNGQLGGNLLLNAVINNAGYTSPRLLEGEDILVRVLDSTTITGTYNKSVKVMTDQYIQGVDNYGFQAYAGVPDGEGGNGYEVAVASVLIDGTNFQLELTEVPAAGFGGRVGFSYNNATSYQEPNNIKISNASQSTGIGTYTTIAPHGLNVGDDVVIARMNPSGFNVIPASVALAGTTGTTINVALASDPGKVTITNATWSGGVATYTTATDHTLDVGYYVTVSGITPSGYNVTAAVVSAADSTTFTIAIVSNPGSYVSGGGMVAGGSIAINGEYGIGRNAGLRGEIFATDIEFYDNASGAPIPTPALIQYATVDEYASNSNILDVLDQCGLTGFFDLVLDLGNTACYGGTGDLVSNLGTLTGADYALGTGLTPDARDPQWSGLTGTFTRNSYFNCQANGKIFTPQGVTNYLANAHKAGGAYTLIHGLLVPATATENQYMTSTARMEGSGQGPGVGNRVGTNGLWTTLVRGDAGASVFSRSSSMALVAGSYALIGCSIQAGDNTSWMYTFNLADYFETFNPVYSTPSSSAAQSLPYIWQDGATGTTRAQTGLQTQFTLGVGAKLDVSRARPLMRSLYRQLILGLTAP